MFSWVAFVVLAVLPEGQDESIHAAAPKTLAVWLVVGTLITGALAWGTERKEPSFRAFDPRTSSEGRAAMRARDTVIRLLATTG